MTPNRSEILFVYDAQDCNPNGNPLGANRPRRDPDTGEGIITDVRLKRYLRDQLLDDGFDIYVKQLGGKSHTRTALVADVLGGITEADEISDVADLGEEFLEAATDVRYFGATLSLESSNDAEDELFRQQLADSLPNSYRGPVQFLPAKSLNKVEMNNEYDSLTSIIATGPDNTQGGFDLDDKRIKYGIFPFWGVVDNNNANTTNLTESDVRRLDTLCWRALKYQTTSRSKLGQEPRLYLRVEYHEGNFHIGGLQNLIRLGEETERPLRSVSDVVLDVTKLVNTLTAEASRIKTIHVLGDRRLTVTNGSRTVCGSNLGELLAENGLNIHEIDVLEERDLAGDLDSG